MLGNGQYRSCCARWWLFHAMLLMIWLALTNGEAPASTALNQTSGTWFVQRGDVFLLQGTYGHVETTFSRPPYYSPCPEAAAASSGQNATFDPLIPAGSLADCTCFPCELHSKVPKHGGGGGKDIVAEAWEYCACLEDVAMDVVQLCVAPNSVLLPVQLSPNTPLELSVPVAAVKPIGSFAVQLWQSTDIVDLEISYGERSWSLNTAEAESLTVCLNSTDDDERDLFMNMRLTPNAGTLVEGTRNYTLSVVFNQAYLPVYLFSAGLHAELLCADLQPNQFALNVGPSVTDAAWLLAAQRARDADQIAQAVAMRQPERINFHLQLTSFDRADLHHYAVFPGLPDVDVMQPADYYFDIPLQSCRVQLSSPITQLPSARDHRPAGPGSAEGLLSLGGLESATAFCQFQQLLMLEHGGVFDAPHSVGSRSCDTEVCHFAYAVHRIFDLELETPAPSYSTLLTWLLPRISDRLARAAVAVSKKAYNTCSYFFWTQLVQANVTASEVVNGTLECVEPPGTAAWASDPCCNRTLPACCAPRTVTRNTTLWQTNATRAASLCEPCMASFVDPLLSVYPNPVVNCSWQPFRISVQDISNGTAVIQRYNQQRVFCDHSLFGNACHSDEDCPLPGQFCSPFRHWCLYACRDDTDCAALSPVSVYHGGVCQSGFCTVPYPLTSDALAASAADTINQFLACASSVRNNLDSAHSSMIAAISNVDSIKIWALAANTSNPATLTPAEVEAQVVDAVFVTSCYGPGAGRGKTAATCLDYQCNWSPLLTCPYHFTTCVQQCQQPLAGGNSTHYCRACKPSATGPVCSEVSTWRGCYSTEPGASDSPFTAEVLLPDVDSADDCLAAGHRWKDDAYNTQASCTTQQPRCSASACNDEALLNNGTACTEQQCTTYGTCVSVNSVPLFMRTFSPGVCVLPLQYSTLFEWYCPPSTTPLYFDPTAEQVDTTICLSLLATSPDECAQQSTPLANYSWVDLSTADACNAWGYCIYDDDDDNNNATTTTSASSTNPLDRQQCELCGGSWRQLVQWRAAAWVKSDPGYMWTERLYSANQNVVARQLNWTSIVQVYGAAFMMPYVRSFQRDATCWYGRHFPLYTVAACTCNSEQGGLVHQTAAAPGTCFADYELPVLWATFPFCSNLTADSAYTTVDSPDFLIPNYTVSLAPSMRRLCIDLTFSSLVPESQAVIFEGSSTGNFAAVLAGATFDESAYLHVYNSKQVKVGLLSGNGVRSIFEPSLRFDTDARLPVCFYSTASDSPTIPLLTGCSDMGSTDFVQVVRRRQIVREGPITNLTRGRNDFVCIYMDREEDLYPCRTQHHPRSITLFDNYTPAQAAGLVITTTAFTLAACLTIVLCCLVHWPIWTKFRISTSVLLFALSFLLFALYSVYFFVIMFGVLDSESPFENFLNLAPIVLSFNMISILLTRWLALGLTSVARRERRLPKKVVIPVALCNLLLYIWMLLVVVGSAFSHSQATTICQPVQPHGWLYYVSYTLRIFLVVLSAAMIVACIVSGVQIYRVLESSIPSRRGFRRIYLFFGLQACVLFALFGQSSLQLVFFVVPSILTFATALIGSIFVSLMPIAILNILIYYASRVSKSRIVSDKPWTVDHQTGSKAGLLAGDEDDTSTQADDQLAAADANDRDVLDELSTGDTHPMLAYITQDDWSVS